MKEYWKRLNKKQKRAVAAAVFIVILLLIFRPFSTTLTVESTAYNSVAAQTSGDPTLSASGKKLRPGDKVIAVSRDLKAAGLTFGTMVSIEGLWGRYEVADVMAKRWTNKIDIYMGTDKKAAREWGKRKVKIRW